MGKRNNKTTETIKGLRPVDDLLFNLIFQDKEACQELLRTILEDETLEVIEVRTQDDIPNLRGRGARLDVLCTSSEGTYFDVEVQRSNAEDHFRRMRYYSSVVTARKTPKSARFSDVAEVYVIYITEFDMLHTGRTICHVDSIIRESKEVIEDGEHRLIVCASVNDGTKAARLMGHFLEPYFEDDEFPNISGQLRWYKHTEKGEKAMCKALEELFAEEMAARDEKHAEEMAAMHEKHAEEMAAMMAELKRLQEIVESK